MTPSAEHSPPRLDLERLGAWLPSVVPEVGGELSATLIAGEGDGFGIAQAGGRVPDGPDEVHKNALARAELRRRKENRERS